MSLEKIIQKRINRIIGGCEEVRNDLGRIDIFTPTDLYELKNIENYKHSIGQIESYSKIYPSHRKNLILICKDKQKLDNYLNKCHLAVRDKDIRLSVVTINSFKWSVFNSSLEPITHVDFK